MTENTAGKSSSSRAMMLGVLVVGVVAVGIIGYGLASKFSRPPASSDVPAAAVVDGAAAFDGVTDVNPPRLLHDFTLTNQDNQPTSLSDFKGRMALMFFGYTHCPDFCPTTLLDFKKIKNALGDKASQVVFVFISVDGERDTPKVMADYVSNFDSEFVGLTGDAATLTRLGSDYDLYFAKRAAADGSSDNYDIDHSTGSYLVDKDGQLVALYVYGTETSVIADDIQKRLS